MDLVPCHLVESWVVVLMDVSLVDKNQSQDPFKVMDHGPIGLLAPSLVEMV